jgi:hypothetical protein
MTHKDNKRYFTTFQVHSHSVSNLYQILKINEPRKGQQITYGRQPGRYHPCFRLNSQQSSIVGIVYHNW